MSDQLIRDPSGRHVLVSDHDSLSFDEEYSLLSERWQIAKAILQRGRIEVTVRVEIEEDLRTIRFHHVMIRVPGRTRRRRGSWIRMRWRQGGRR